MALTVYRNDTVSSDSKEVALLNAGFESQFTGTAAAWLQERIQLTHAAVAGNEKFTYDTCHSYNTRCRLLWYTQPITYSRLVQNQVFW